MKRKKKNSPTVRTLVLAVILLAAAACGHFYYRNWLQPNTVKSGKLYIPTGADYKQVMDSLRPFLEHESTFEWLAARKKYPQLVKPGRYTLHKGEGNSALINRLRLGQQDEIAIRIGNYASIYEMAGKLGALLEPDSAKLVAAMTGAGFAAGYSPDALLFFYFPDTYNFHWNTSAAQFVERMKKVYDQYWTEERKQQAARQQLSPFQATTLASIVQLESGVKQEQPQIAGLYLNRLRIGMKLDADPTVIYALQKAGGFKAPIHRVYFKDLAMDSPYNTYRYRGLPPGPICMPDRSAIEAVLHPAQHDYLYFVADPQRPGYSLFAKTLAEQEANAAKYREWANQNNVK